MYSLDINFLKDRKQEEAAKTTTFDKSTVRMPAKTMAPLVAGVVAMGILPGAAFGSLWLLNRQKAELETEVAALDSNISQLQVKSQDIEALQQQINQVNAQTNALVSVFNQLKSWSAIFEDLRDRIPTGVQISSIEQSGSQLTINGIARSYSDVNNFLLSLQQSSFIQDEQTRIASAETVDNPINIAEGSVPENVTVQLPEVVNYSISTEISDVPASEIMAELSRKGAVGLVTRIRTLEQKGAIAQ